MKKLFLLFFFMNIFHWANAQLTYVPDDAFEAYLESNFPNCATGGIDDFVIGYEVIGSVSLINLPIQNLNGIENLNYIHSIFISNCTYLNFIDLSNVNVNNINITNVNSIGLNVQGMSITIAYCPNVTNINIPQGYISCIEVTGNMYLLHSVEFQSTNILKTGLPCGGIIILKNILAPNWDFIDLSMIQVELGCSGFDIEDDFRCVLLNNNGYLNWYYLSCYDSNETNGLTCVQIENPGYAENAWPSYNDFTYSQQCNSCITGIDNREVNGVISLYPNPTSSEITITSDKFTNEPYTLYDQMGRTVGSGILADTSTTISLSTLSKGIYILKVEGAYESAIVVKE